MMPRRKRQTSQTPAPAALRSARKEYPVSVPSMDASHRLWTPLVSRAPAALAVFLWLGATLYLLGDTGKIGDDYTVAMRDPATGAIDLARHPWARWEYFWRPLHLAHASFINTISWNHPWIGHLELALIHAAVACMLMGSLERMGVRRPIAWTASLLFMLCPLIAGAVLCSSTSCNAISSIFLLRTLELVRRQAVGPHSALRVLWVGLLSLATACWYEPAAAALAAVPLVFLAASRRDGISLGTRLRGALPCTLAAGLGSVAYAILLVATAPPRARGGTESLITLADLLPRARWFLSDLASATVGPHALEVLSGSIHQGWLALQSPAGWVLIALAVVLAVLATIAITARSVPQRQISPPERTARGLTALIGAAVFSAALLPILVVPSQVVAFRSLYVPFLGLAICAAALASGAAAMLASAPVPARRAITALGTSAALATALAGAVGMIGVQTELRNHALLDQSTVRQLRSLVPDPAPGTVFLPLRIDAREAAPARYGYDPGIHSAFEAPWTCDAIVRIAFGRNDITATPTPRCLRNPEPGGFRRFQNPALITWDRCIPFAVDREGVVHLFHRLTVVPSDRAAFEAEFPRVPTFLPGVAAVEPLAMLLREVNNVRCRAEDVVVAQPDVP